MFQEFLALPEELSKHFDAPFEHSDENGDISQGLVFKIGRKFVLLHLFRRAYFVEKPFRRHPNTFSKLERDNLLDSNTSTFVDDDNLDVVIQQAQAKGWL